jgi:hypothetical protein
LLKIETNIAFVSIFRLERSPLTNELGADWPQSNLIVFAKPDVAAAVRHRHPACCSYMPETRHAPVGIQYSSQHQDQHADFARKAHNEKFAGPDDWPDLDNNTQCIAGSPQEEGHLTPAPVLLSYSLCVLQNGNLQHSSTKGTCSCGSIFYIYDHEHIIDTIDVGPLELERILKLKKRVHGLLLGAYVKQFVPGELLEVIIVDTITTTHVPKDKCNYFVMHLPPDMTDVFDESVKQGVKSVND